VFKVKINLLLFVYYDMTLFNDEKLNKKICQNEVHVFEEPVVVLGVF